MTKVWTLTTTHTNLRKVNFDRIATYSNGNVIYFRTPTAAEKFAEFAEKVVAIEINECTLPSIATIHG